MLGNIWGSFENVPPGVSVTSRFPDTSRRKLRLAYYEK